MCSAIKIRSDSILAQQFEPVQQCSCSDEAWSGPQYSSECGCFQASYHTSALKTSSGTANLGPWTVSRGDSQMPARKITMNRMPGKYFFSFKWNTNQHSRPQWRRSHLRLPKAAGWGEEELAGSDSKITCVYSGCAAVT